MERIKFHLPRLPLCPLKLGGKLKQSTALCLTILDQLGKSCVEEHTQVARVTWRCKKVREQFVVLFLKEINRECSNMCSNKNRNILRKTSEENIANF